jgi:hypothetical protein
MIKDNHFVLRLALCGFKLQMYLYPSQVSAQVVSMLHMVLVISSFWRGLTKEVGHILNEKHLRQVPKCGHLG